MNKNDFFYILKQQIYENPEWFEEVITVASNSVLEKIKDERKVSVNIQTSLIMSHEQQFSKLSKENKMLVLGSILECDSIEGSLFYKEIQEKLKSIKTEEQNG